MSLEIVVFEAAALIARDVAEFPAEKRGAAYAKFLAELGRVLGVTAAAAPVEVRGVSAAEASARGTAKQQAADKAGAETKPAAKDAELEQAVQKVEADAKNDASGAVESAGTKGGAQTEAADTAPLDYLKDVAPTLNKLAKANRDGLVALFAEHGAKKGADLKPNQYRAVLDAAIELLAEAEAKAEAAKQAVG